MCRKCPVLIISVLMQPTARWELSRFWHRAWKRESGRGRGWEKQCRRMPIMGFDFVGFEYREKPGVVECLL